MNAGRWRGAPTGVVLGGALLLSGCNGDPAVAPSATTVPSGRVVRGGATVAARDRGDVCTDLGPIRVCWGRECARSGCVDVRPLPEPEAISALGWRCTGIGAERRCVDRSTQASGFECREKTCVQRHPRLPGDGEWLCADSAGAVVCAGGVAAAGVAPAREQAGWFCGTRGGTRAVAAVGARAQPTPMRAPDAGPRVCVDFDADFPDRVATNWRCHYAYERGTQRVCRRDVESSELGDRCDAARPCVDGSHCTAGYCIPPRPAPGCWLDSDCASSACRFGACAAPDR